MNLFQTQKNLFQKVLNISDLDEQMQLKNNDKYQSSWKVLIYDDHTFNILSYFKTGFLRENNITLHLHIKQNKLELLSVQVIYFIQPTQESIDQFLNDVKKNYFEQIYLCFAGSIHKNQLTQLCDNIIQSGKTALIKKIIQVNLDQFLLNNCMFTCLMMPSFEKRTIQIAQKLFNFILFLGVTPLIMYEKNDLYGSEIYQELEKIMKNEDYLGDRPINSDQTKILYIHENLQIELSLMHHFTYFSLILDNFDVCRNQNNLTNFQIDDQKIQFDFSNDHFLQENLYEDYPIVGEKIYNNIQEWKKKYDKFTQNKEDDITDNFNEAIENLPQITEEKKINYMHLKISSELMKKIEERNLEKLSVIQQRVVDNKKLSNEDFQELKFILENNSTLITDKLRILIVVGTYGKLTVENFSILVKILEKDDRLNQQQIQFLHQFQTQHRSQDNKQDLLSSIKSSSIKLLNQIYKSSYRYQSTQVLLDIIQNKEDQQNLEFRNVLAGTSVAKPKDIDQVILFSVNGGDINEYHELQKVLFKNKIELIYGMDFLRNYMDILNKQLRQIQQLWIKEQIKFPIQKHNLKFKVKEGMRKSRAIYRIIY